MSLMPHLSRQSVARTVYFFLSVSLLINKASGNAPFVLRVQPAHVSVRFQHPIYIRVSISNITNHRAYIWEWLNPAPFGRGKHCLWSLKMRCINLKTNKEVRYLYPVRGVVTTADALGKELPSKVAPHRSLSAIVNLYPFCDMPPGDYRLVMQYDTTEVYKRVMPDKRAWHGKTNMAKITIHISR